MMFPTQPNKNYTCHELCLVPRRLSLDENVRAKEGGKETTGETSFRLPSVPFPWSLAIHNQSLAITLRQTKRLRRRLPRAVFSFSLPFFLECHIDKKAPRPSFLLIASQMTDLTYKSSKHARSIKSGFQQL